MIRNTPSMRLTLVLLLLVMLAGCSEQPPLDVIDPITQGNPDREADASWQTTTLTDVRDSRTVQPQQLPPEPYFITTFAVWCERCDAQLEELESTQYTYLAIHVDEAETQEEIEQYASSRGFSGYVVQASSEYTQSLISEFGPGIANIPSSPVVLVCADQTRAFPAGLQTSEELIEVVNQQC